MICHPSQQAASRSPFRGRNPIRERAVALLGAADQPVLAAAPASLDGDTADAALATALMDQFRRTGDVAVFDCLVQWVEPQLLARIRLRLRGLAGRFDPQEILQDTIVNIFRYPDRFQATRPGAFAAWSSTIVDNAIGRQLRRERQGVSLTLRSPELLQEHADHGGREPSRAAQDHEECESTAAAFGVLLGCYLAAFLTLSERERYVLQMVEVGRLRYQELAGRLGIRPEALKMVVFRARKRLLERTGALLGGAPAAAVSGADQRLPVPIGA